MPRVSVIVPNFNHLKYLPERLESIFSQSFEDFEVILLDDGSTDGSAPFLKDFEGKPHVSTVVVAAENGGSAFRQWEKGFALASGELIWIAESDDSCAPDLLATLVAEFDRNPRTVLAFCASMLTGPDGSPLGVHRYQKAIGRDLRTGGPSFIRRHLLKRNCVVNASGALFRKDAIALVDSAFLQYKGVGDWLFWTCIALQGDVAFVNRPLNFFRQHGGNTTAAMKTGARDLVELHSLLGDFARLGLRRPVLWLRYRVYAVHSLKYGVASQAPNRTELLALWKDNPAVSALAFIKHLFSK